MDVGPLGIEGINLREVKAEAAGRITIVGPMHNLSHWGKTVGNDCLQMARTRSVVLLARQWVSEWWFNKMHGLQAYLWPLTRITKNEMQINVYNERVMRIDTIL